MEAFKRRKCFSSDKEILDYAAELAKRELLVERKTSGFTEPSVVRDFLNIEYARHDPEREQFIVLLFDAKAHLIDSVVLFQGGVCGVKVYIREIVKLALQHNACSVVLSHSHPNSGCPEPSPSDVKITGEIKAALDVLDIVLADHLIVGNSTEEAVSFFERGLL